MKRTPLESRIEEIITPVVKDAGLELVSVKITGEGGTRTVQVMAEDPATRNLPVGKCAELSRSLSAILDVEDPIEGTYRLEVSSPGIDRPLLKPKDFETYAGYEAKLETETPIATGQKRFKGILRGIEGDTVKITTEQGEAEIPYGSIAKAKLVLTDKLIKEMAQASV